MTAKTINGILFIVAGIAPLIIYLGLGPDGTGLLEVDLTEKLATWLMFSAPIAIMMTRDSIKGGEGYGLVNAGFLIFIIAWPVGIVADAFNGAFSCLTPQLPFAWRLLIPVPCCSRAPWTRMGTQLARVLRWLVQPVRFQKPHSTLLVRRTIGTPGCRMRTR